MEEPSLQGTQSTHDERTPDEIAEDQAIEEALTAALIEALTRMQPRH
jgi:hypothetical protein